MKRIGGRAEESDTNGRPSIGSAERPPSGRLLLLYLTVFWSQFKPSEPFLVDYLVDDKGFTNVEVFQRVFNLFTYSRLPTLLLVGLLSECPQIGNRGILFGGALCGLATTALTRFGGLRSQQAAQLLVATAFASRSAAASVVFAIAEPEHFQESIHTVKALLLLSNSGSALLGELLRDEAGTQLASLFDVSLAGQALYVVFALLLLLQRQTPVDENVEENEEATKPSVGGFAVFGQAALPLSDLWRSLRLKRVLWWTGWALAMNPVHGLALTYWQSLVRSRNIVRDHNGYVLASMYLLAACLTVLTGQSRFLQGRPSLLVIGSMLVAGASLCLMAAQTHQLPLYSWLLLYQCVFEVMAAVATFQVGAEVFAASMRSPQNSPRLARPPPPLCSPVTQPASPKPSAAAALDFARRSPLFSPASASPACLPDFDLLDVVEEEEELNPRCARLTLLFSATGVAASLLETAAQLLAQATAAPMPTRFRSLGLALASIAAALICAAGARRARGAEGEGIGNNRFNVTAALPAVDRHALVPLLKIEGEAAEHTTAERKRISSTECG